MSNLNRQRERLSKTQDLICKTLLPFVATATPNAGKMTFAHLLDIAESNISDPNLKAAIFKRLDNVMPLSIPPPQRRRLEMVLANRTSS